MKLIVLSPASGNPREGAMALALLEHGLESYHVHKPDLSSEQVQDYIRQFPLQFRDRIFLHSAFPKFHSLDELKRYDGKYEYAFLSPVFDSISKKGYKSGFDLSETGLHVRGKKIVALGGVDESKIETCRGLGFCGIAVLGAVWQSADPLGTFLRIKEKCQRKDLVC